MFGTDISKFNFTKFDSLGNPSNPIVLGGGDTPIRDPGTGAQADVVFILEIRLMVLYL